MYILKCSSQSSPVDPASSSSLGGVVMKIRKAAGTTLTDISAGSSVPMGQTLALTIEAPGKQTLHKRFAAIK